jgi:hypothetical protein
MDQTRRTHTGSYLQIRGKTLCGVRAVTGSEEYFLLWRLQPLQLDLGVGHGHEHTDRHLNHRRLGACHTGSRFVSRYTSPVSPSYPFQHMGWLGRWMSGETILGAAQETGRNCHGRARDSREQSGAVFLKGRTNQRAGIIPTQTRRSIRLPHPNAPNGRNDSTSFR